MSEQTISQSAQQPAGQQRNHPTKTYSRDEQGRRVLTVSSASQSGGMAQVVGGHLFRCYYEGDRSFVIQLPGNIKAATIEVIAGAMLGLNAKIELAGPGAERVQEYLAEQAEL